MATLRHGLTSLCRTHRPAALGNAVIIQSRLSSIKALQDAFRDPTSPFHIPPGSVGPESPDSPAHSVVAGPKGPKDALEEAQNLMIKRGFDPTSFWEQRIVWGDHDSFQHVNNVRYVRFFESARIQWMTSLGHSLGGPEKAEAMVKGQGVSLILKSIEVQFRRPVTYPDTLLIGYRPLVISAPQDDLAAFPVAASAYSLGQKAFVAHSRETLVWYDYEQLKKCDPGEEARAIVLNRAQQGTA